MLKKLLACLLILTVCAVAFCACADNQADDGEPSETVTESAKETDPVTPPDDGGNDDGNNDDGGNDDGNNDDGNNDGDNEDQTPGEGFAPAEGDDEIVDDEDWTPVY